MSNDEEATILVCTLAAVPLMFADNVTSDCAECGAQLQHRPHFPPKARKVCEACAMKLIGGGRAAGDEVKVGVTRETLRELALYYNTGRRQ